MRVDLRHDQAAIMLSLTLVTWRGRQPSIEFVALMSADPMAVICVQATADGINPPC